MGQTSYSLQSGTSFSGMIADAGDTLVESGIALNAMNYGNAAGAEAGDTSLVHMPVRDKGTLTYNGDFTPGDVIIVTINGVACGTVTFGAGPHATVAAAVLAAIAANAGVTASSASANGRVFTVETSGEVISIAVTGSSTTATASENYITPQNDVFRGVVVHRNKEMSGLGVAQSYAANDVVDILRKGRIWVNTSETVVADDDAYVDLAGGLGKFCKTSTNNLATGGKFRSAVTGAGLAILEINLP